MRSQQDQTPALGAPVPPRNNPLRALSYPQFRMFWAASLVSIISFFMTNIARGWLILDMTDSPFMVTAINGVGMLPMLVFSAFGGVIADRMSRKLILITADAFNSVILGALALLVMTDLIEIWHLFLLTILHGFSFALAMPARAATVGNILSHRDLPSGVALFTTIFSGSALLGPALAGYLINAFGMGLPYAVSCVLLAPAVTLMSTLRLSRPVDTAGNGAPISVLQSIAQGVAYVRQSPILTGLLLLGLAATVFAMPFQVMLPVFARDILDVGADGLGMMGGVAGAGAIVGSLTVAAFSSQSQLRHLMLAGGVGLGATIVFFAFSTVYLLSLLLLLLIGFLTQIFMTSNFTLVQVSAPDYIRGRVLSLRMIAMGVGPLGMFALGATSEAIGAPRATAVMGAISLVLTMAIMMAIPLLRRVEAQPEEPEPALAPEAITPTVIPAPRERQR
ncbi:MAG: MFS transporter [Chloroflexi bacterium]|nr:MFS transporter [Chloroflexota bacterium]